MEESVSVFSIIFVLIIISLMIWVKYYIKCLCSKPNEKSKILNKFEIYFNYFITPLQLIYSVFNSSIFVLVTGSKGVKGVLIYLIVYVITSSIFLYLNYLFYHKSIASLRSIHLTKKDTWLIYFRNYIFFLLIVLPTFFYKNILSYFSASDLMFFSGIIIFLFVFSLLYPYLFYFRLGATSFCDKDKKSMIVDFLNRKGIYNIEVFKYPGEKWKEANAYIIGLWKKRIFISDYLLSHLSDDEILAVLAHEIGHIKKKHLWLKISYIFLLYPLFLGISSIMDVVQKPLEKLIYQPLLIFLGILFLFSFLIAYFLFYAKIERFFEYQADLYAIKCEISPKILISALQKIALLNDQRLSLNRVDEKLRSHPSIQKRIKFLEEINSRR